MTSNAPTSAPSAAEQPAVEPSAPPDLARKFPLVPRPRPPAHPLSSRIDEITALARLATTGPPQRRLRNATRALNQAALIASDTGNPELARDLCWHQFHALVHLGPHPDLSSTAVLQPLVNLGRLADRDGKPDEACALYKNLHHAISTRTNAHLAGRVIDLGGFFTDAQTRNDQLRFVWAVVLADGTRALTRAGHWHTALDQLHRYRGVGYRMLDGRQTAVLTHALHDDLNTALTLIDTSQPVERWEHAIIGVLRTLAHAANGHPIDTTPMLDSYLALRVTGTNALFHVALGLAALDLTTNAEQHRLIAAQLTANLRAHPDARTATQLIQHRIAQSVMSAADTAAAHSIKEQSTSTRRNGVDDRLAELNAAATAAMNQIQPDTAHPHQSCKRHA